MSDPSPTAPAASEREATGSALGVRFAILVYLGFQAAFLYLIGFLNDGLLVPKGVNDGVVRAWSIALAIDVGLVLLWGVQHTVMARRSFKERFTRIVAPHMERSFYCFASVVALFLAMLLWSPLPGVVWDAPGRPLRIAIYVLQGAGWLFALAASHEIDHWELFGVKQAWYALKGRTLPEHELQERYTYRIVRHPIQTGTLFAMWLHPTMTWGHLLFAGLMTVYMVVGLRYEERDLDAHFGERYDEYRGRVAKLIPFVY